MTRRLILILLFPLVLVIGLILGQGGFLEAGILPPCMINSWWGLHCPGCGGTRAFQALARADLMGALKMNPFGVVFIFVVALFLLRTSWEAAFPEKKWPRWSLSRRWWWGLLITVVAYSVLRNLPWSPFTLLAPP
jgi:hypothetical protein